MNCLSLLCLLLPFIITKDVEDRGMNIVEFFALVAYYGAFLWTFFLCIAIFLYLFFFYLLYDFIFN